MTATHPHVRRDWLRDEHVPQWEPMRGKEPREPGLAAETVRSRVRAEPRVGGRAPLRGSLLARAHFGVRTAPLPALTPPGRPRTAPAPARLGPPGGPSSPPERPHLVEGRQRVRASPAAWRLPRGSGRTGPMRSSFPAAPHGPGLRFFQWQRAWGAPGRRLLAAPGACSALSPGTRGAPSSSQGLRWPLQHPPSWGPRCAVSCPLCARGSLAGGKGRSLQVLPFLSPLCTVCGRRAARQLSEAGRSLRQRLAPAPTAEGRGRTADRDRLGQRGWVSEAVSGRGPSHQCRTRSQGH